MLVNSKSVTITDVSASPVTGHGPELQRYYEVVVSRWNLHNAQITMYSFNPTSGASADLNVFAK